MLRFSIIVPIYNVEKDIRQCFESISNQTFKDFEVLCIDDCGTDNSMDIVREFTQNDSRFKILTHDTNKGVATARMIFLHLYNVANIYIHNTSHHLLSQHNIIS